MIGLTNIRFCIREHTVSFHADVRSDRITEKYAGQQNLVFFFTIEEFIKEFPQNYLERGYSDGGHQVVTSGDRCTFYEFSPFDLRNRTGTVPVKYTNVNIPLFVRKVLAKFVALKLKQRGDGNDEVYIEISDERAARWNRNYGCGKGKAEIEFRNPETRQFFEQLIGVEAEKGESLKEDVDYLLDCVRGRTSRFWETEKLHLSKDLDGFNFSYQRGNGRLYGGIVNHERDDSKPPRWSTHT